MDNIDRGDFLAQTGEYVTLATQQISGSSVNKGQVPFVVLLLCSLDHSAGQKDFQVETDFHFTRTLTNVTTFSFMKKAFLFM